MACLAGCSGGGGSLELTLTLPTMTDLRPTGMTTVTLTATAPGEPPTSTTSVLVDNAFSAGELPVGDDIQIGIVLRDVSNRIVGVGEAGQTVDIVGDKPTAIAIPVRRPFVYASAAGALHSFDPTLDPRDTRFQGTLAGITMPLVTVSVGGDRLAVVSANQVQVVVTATNTVTGAIPIPAGVRDATSVPGTHKLAIAHATGVSIVDLDTSAVATADVGPVDRVTVGPAADGTLYAYGLVARSTAPELPGELAACTGASSVVAVAVDAPQATAPKPLGAAVSDLAAAPDTPMLFATLPCTGQVSKIVGDVQAEVGTLSLEMISTLERASVLTVAGDRVWAAGTRMSTPRCTTGCTPTTPVACPQPAGNHLAFVDESAAIVVQSIPTDGATPPIELEAPGRRETIIDRDDLARQHAQVLKALSAVPLDLVTLPGGQYVGVVTKSRYYIEEYDPTGLQVILPCLDLTSADWLLIDLASSSVAQRVRTSCDLTVGPADVFDRWECDQPPDGEQRAFPSDYEATSVGALFGAR